MKGSVSQSTCFWGRKSGFKKPWFPPGGGSTGEMGAESRGRGETGAWPAGRREGVEAKLVLGARWSVSLVLLLSSGSLQDDARSLEHVCLIPHKTSHDDVD